MLEEQLDLILGNFFNLYDFIILYFWGGLHVAECHTDGFEYDCFGNCVPL